MRRSYFRLLEGVLFSLPMLFASCGNGDNALEEIINGGGSEGGGSTTINATGITFDQTLKVFKSGDAALTITATVTPSDATFTWESSDEAVATVANGVVTPKGVGIATITAKSGDVTATCEVFVGNEVDLGTKTDDYTVQNYDILKGTLDDSYAISIPNDSKVTFNGMKTKKQITCSGDATIILADNSENEVKVSTDGEAGIKIGDTGKTLTINGETAGDGKLTVQGGSGAAGIGTNVNSTGGNIVINGGTVTATGGGRGAGIGTGDAYMSANTCGAITINGGTVTAKGGGWAAGIGTGEAYMPGDNTCGAITINGGTVTATGGEFGAGIGTGLADGATNKCDDITINGGTVNATGGYAAAGIGTGRAGANTQSTCGAITISANVTKVTAKRGDLAPKIIGTGHEDSDATQTCGKIKFGTAEVYDGASTWDTSIVFNTNGDYGPYGGLNLNISTTTNGHDTWVLTPVAP